MVLILIHDKLVEPYSLPTLCSAKSLWCSNKLILPWGPWTAYWIINNTEECQGLYAGNYLQRCCRCRGGKKSSCVRIQLDFLVLPLKYSFVQSPEFPDNNIPVFFPYSWTCAHTERRLPRSVSPDSAKSSLRQCNLLVSELYSCRYFGLNSPSQLPKCPKRHLVTTPCRLVPVF